MIRGKPRHYRVVCAYEVEQLVVEALPIAMQLVEALCAGTPFDLAAELTRLRRLVSRYRLGPSTRAIADAAQRRGIPWRRITETSSLLQLGWGVQQKRVQATMTGNTNHIAVEIASDKALTKQLLDSVGLPVPKGDVVKSAEEAVQVAAALRAPVAVKPLDANQGKGVTTGITTPQDIRTAFQHAYEYSSHVMVEKYIAGDDYRVLVVGDKVIAASRRSPPQVVGDGVASIRVLVEIENRNPLRAEGHGGVLTKIPLDAVTEHVVAAQGYKLDSVPSLGKTVVLRRNANLSTGGTAEDVTALLHPDIARACVRSAQRIGLDVAGIDLVCRDIGRALEQQGGAIIEVNAAPGIRMHEHPTHGSSRRAGEAIVENLFGPTETGRIPVIAVTGTNGKTTTTLLIGHVLRQAGTVVGMCTTEGIFVNGRQIEQGDCTGYWSAQKVLGCPDVETAVLETARGGILKRGLGFDACDVGVVLNVQDDHLGQDGVNTIEELAAVKALIAEGASKVAVLNADDPHCVAMRDKVSAGVEVILFSMNCTNRVLREHLARGGRGVYVRDGRCFRQSGHEATALIDARELPFTLNGAAKHNEQNALAAIAALWGAGVCDRDIVAGLTSFVSSVASNPLRLNVFVQDGVTILLDYAHNAAGYRALIDTARSLGAQRLIGVAAAPGDRLDDKIKDLGQICGAFLDELVTCDMDDKRGRARKEAAQLLSQGALESGMHPRYVHVVSDYRDAIRTAHSLCHAGDVLLIACASHVHDFTEALAQATECREVRPRVHPTVRHHHVEDSGTQLFAQG
jgi:cyanophycin synthetase